MAEKVTGRLYESLTGELFEIGRQLRQKNGYPFNPESLKKHLQDAVRGRFACLEAQNKFLRLISGGEALIIDECDGSRIIADAQDIFVHIDSDFKNWDTRDTFEKESATKETPAQVYEMEKDGTFPELFGSLSLNPWKVCLTQNQILNFVKKYRDWLRADGCGTFFLFQSKGQFLIVRMGINSFGGLEVDMEQFGCSLVWHTVYRHRVVVPQLA